MRIKPKTQIAFLGIGLIPLVLIGWFSLEKTGEILAGRSLEQLTSVALIQEKRIESIIAQNLERLNLVRSRTQLRINLSRHSLDPQETHRQGMLRILIDAKRSIRSFRNLSIAGLDGRVIVSTNPEWEGKDVSSEGYFQEGMERIQAGTFRKEAGGELLTILSGPLTLETTLGVLLIESSAEGYLSVAQSYEGLGETGETIVLLEAKPGVVHYLTPLRFGAHAMLTTVPGGEPGWELAGAAFAGSEEILKDALDYRARPVLAVSRQIDLGRLAAELSGEAPGAPRTGVVPDRMALLIKIDQAEAFGPIAELRAMTLMVLGITLAAVLIVSVLLSNSITGPLRELTQTAAEISGGNLNKRAAIKGSDEIVLLARDFNSMARSLTEANHHLEENVAERTRELKASEERYALAVKGSTDGLWDWNVLTSTVSYSDRFRELLGYRPDEFEDTFAAWESRLHPEDLVSTLDAVKAHLEEGQPYDVEYRLRCGDGSYRWFRARGIAVRDANGKATRMAGSISDVTDRKLAVELLRQSNKELEQFAYVASHDLQEPLRMISSYMQLLNERYRTKLDAEAGEFIDFAVDGAQRMQRLISDLLLYSRVGTRGREHGPTATSQVVATALINLCTAIEKRSAAITQGELPWVTGDETQLVQLFQNLIGNAIKFCPQDRTPVVHISAERQGHRWLFRVKDNGIGISAKECPQVFEIFKRLHSREEYEGTGIGLSICQKIVERHGGKIWVESEPGQGSTFFFTLPESAAAG